MSGHTNEVQLIGNQGWDERILVCRNGDLVDTFIVVTDRYVVIVDTMINTATAARLAAIATAHLRRSRRLLVVNTHADYDHCWGNQYFAGENAANPAPVMGHRLCARQFRRQEARAYLVQMQETEPRIFGSVILTPPGVVFDGQMQVHGGNLTLELFHTPGHAPDHISIFIPEIRTLIAADAAELPFPFARTAADLPQMRASLRQMASLKPDHVLYCHAPVTMGLQLIHHNIAYFDRVEEACRAALAAGAPLENAADADLPALIDLTYADAVPDGPEWRNVHPFYQTTGHGKQIRMMLDSIGAAA